jgi:hypothetical protein
MLALEVFGAEAGWPFGAAECAVVETDGVLVAGEVAVLAKGSDVEPVAIGIEVVLSGIIIPFDLVFSTEVARLLPGFGFDAD